MDRVRFDMRDDDMRLVMDMRLVIDVDGSSERWPSQDEE
jgi:hypothetical protein